MIVAGVLFLLAAALFIPMLVGALLLAVISVPIKMTWQVIDYLGDRRVEKARQQARYETVRRTAARGRHAV